MDCNAGRGYVGDALAAGWNGRVYVRLLGEEIPR